MVTRQGATWANTLGSLGEVPKLRLLPPQNESHSYL